MLTVFWGTPCNLSCSIGCSFHALKSPRSLACSAAFSESKGALLAPFTPPPPPSPASTIFVKSIVSGMMPLIGSACAQNGIFLRCPLASSLEASCQRLPPPPSSSSSSSPSSLDADESSYSSMSWDREAPHADEPPMSAPSLLTIAPPLDFDDALLLHLLGAAAMGGRVWVSAVSNLSLIFAGSPTLNENSCRSAAAALSLAAWSAGGGSPCALFAAAAPMSTPSVFCSTSASTRESASARCAISPSIFSTSKYEARLCTVCDTFGISSFCINKSASIALRASGSVSTNRQLSGNSRPIRSYSFFKKPASNCRALCAASTTERPPPRCLAAATYSSNSSATRANDGTLGAFTMALVMPVSWVMKKGTTWRPGLTSVLIGAWVGSDRFTAAISMMRWLSLLSPVVSRSNTTTVGIS
mmetsp:Transcript_27461/g.67478  ORF Transcript_27461/g.67478 Transcript_27461/m.67478 type:complete len:415 (-) Transcript_27461:210-1454(-)